jgi:CRP-like cAMP-binding protein
MEFDIACGRMLTHEDKVANLRRIGQFKARTIEAIGRDRLHWVDTACGGCLLFLGREWQAPLVEQVRSLLRWASDLAIPVRVALHYGGVQLVEDEAGLVGQTGDLLESIGWFLTLGADAAVVASEEFRAALGDQPGVEFHEERHLYRTDGEPQVLHLMSLRDLGPCRQWPPAATDDHLLLRDARAARRTYEVLYHAKRILAVNGEDTEAIQALDDLKPEDFFYRTARGARGMNGMLARLTHGDLRRLIGLGQLLEYGHGQVICRRGDGGSAMLLVLRGQVSVCNDVEDGEAAVRTRPLVTHAAGETVAELAFWLNRPRTADLVAVGDAAVLTFQWSQVERLLKEAPREDMNAKALEYVAQRIPYLIGRHLSTLTEAEKSEWIGHLGTLREGCDVITCRPHKAVTLRDLRRRARATAAGGVYILVSGHLRSRSTPGKRLDGDGRDLPLLYVDLHDLVVVPNDDYTADWRPAKVLFISGEAIKKLHPDVREGVVRRLKHAMPHMYSCDVFLIHSLQDAEIVTRWQEGLAAQGLTVFRDTVTPFTERWDQRCARMLLDSLLTIVFVSPNMTPDTVAMQEKAFRERHFAENPLIATVLLPGGSQRQLEITYSPVDTIDQVASRVRAIRSGKAEPPYGLRRQTGTRLT